MTIPDINSRSTVPEHLLTIEEIATYLRVTPRTVYTLTKDSNLPRLKVGRLVRFRLSEVLETLSVGVHSRSSTDAKRPLNESSNDPSPVPNV